MKRWVVDTSPLLFLAKLNRLSLLQHDADEILIPKAVLEEVNFLQDEASQLIKQVASSWLIVQEVTNLYALTMALADLDRGEAEVIALAQEVEAERVVLDDLDARRFGRRVGYPSIGTLGLLLAGKLRGEIGSLKDEIERLQDHGFWASQSLVEAVLKAAGEQ